MERVGHQQLRADAAVLRVHALKDALNDALADAGSVGATIIMAGGENRVTISAQREFGGGEIPSPAWVPVGRVAVRRVRSWRERIRSRPWVSTVEVAVPVYECRGDAMVPASELLNSGAATQD